MTTQEKSELTDILKNIFTEKYYYKIISFKKLEDEEFVLKAQPFETVLTTNIFTEKDVQSFVSSFQDITKETMRSSKNKRKPSQEESENHQYVFKKTYRCQHNTRNSTSNWKPDKRCKNTSCPFVLTIKIHNLSYRKRRSPESLYNEDMPCEIHITYRHNHNTQVLQALSYRDVGEESKNVYLDLFQNSQTQKPSIAQAEFKRRLKSNVNDENDYELVFADRKEKPRSGDVQRIYRDVNLRLYGPQNGPELIEKLNEKREEYNKQYSEEGGRIEFEIEQLSEVKCDAEVRFAIAIVTPIMSRVHTTIKHSQELAFCDSMSNVDEFNSRFFLV